MSELRAVLRRWRERPLLWVAVALVAALHALGAAAPLVANDAPLWLSGEQGWHFPALAATAGFERFLLLLAPWILALPLWAPSRWCLRVALLGPALALVAACASELAAPARAFVPAGEWKRQLGARPALFAPIPFG